MKRKLLVIFAILSLGLFLIAQTPTKETWEDFATIMSGIGRAESEINSLYKGILKLEAAKAEILGDVDRKNRLIKILDVHPDHEVSAINAKLLKLKDLREWLEENGYIPGYVPPIED